MLSIKLDSRKNIISDNNLFSTQQEHHCFQQQTRLRLGTSLANRSCKSYTHTHISIRKFAPYSIKHTMQQLTATLKLQHTIVLFFSWQENAISRLQVTCLLGLECHSLLVNHGQFTVLRQHMPTKMINLPDSRSKLWNLGFKSQNFVVWKSLAEILIYDWLLSSSKDGMSRQPIRC